MLGSGRYHYSEFDWFLFHRPSESGHVLLHYNEDENCSFRELWKPGSILSFWTCIILTTSPLISIVNTSLSLQILRSLKIEKRGEWYSWTKKIWNVTQTSWYLITSGKEVKFVDDPGSLFPIFLSKAHLMSVSIQCLLQSYQKWYNSNLAKNVAY